VALANSSLLTNAPRETISATHKLSQPCRKIVKRRTADINHFSRIQKSRRIEYNFIIETHLIASYAKLGGKIRSKSDICEEEQRQAKFGALKSASERAQIEGVRLE
jgi:hypothetical protein